MSEKGSYTCLRGKTGKELALANDMKSLMQITGAPSEKHLITALARYKIRHIRGLKCVKTKASGKRFSASWEKA